MSTNRPSFQFYPADWRNNAKLRRCSEAARGVWMDVLCVLHDSDEYGVCRWPLADLARASNAPLKYLKELAQKDVLKGADSGASAYVYTPRHGGKNGDPVTLVEPGDGPCWYCSRFVRDEWVRLRRGSSSHFSSDNQPPKRTPKSQPKGGIGEPQGYGPSSSSSSSSSVNTNKHTHQNTEPRGVWVGIDDQGEPGPPPQPTAAGTICKALKAAGLANVSPQHPALLALIERGVTAETFADAAATAVSRGKGFDYAIGILRRQLDEAAEIGELPKAQQQPAMHPDSRAAVEAEGEAKGFGRWNETRERWDEYKARVRGLAPKKRLTKAPVMAAPVGAM